MLIAECDGLRILRDQLAEMQVDVPREIAIAGTKTVKKGRSLVAKRIAQVVRLPQGQLKKATRYKVFSTYFVLRIRGQFQIAIRRFRPRHTRQGVVVSTRRTGGGKEVYSDAFMGPRPGVPATKLRGNPVRRKTAERLPIQALPAVRVVQVVREAQAVLDSMGDDLRSEYEKQIRERIRFQNLKLAGKLRNQKR